MQNVIRESLRASRCALCRYSTTTSPLYELRFRVQSAAPQLLNAAFPVQRTAARSLASSGHKHLSTAPEGEKDAPYPTQQSETTLIEDDPAVEAPVEISESDNAVSTLPWYLQVQEPVSSASPSKPDLEALPPLPDGAPPILRPMLEHLYNTIGLDDLALIDLRKADPPPALGSSLIMLFATARSVKHLNHSADRFCRWLRTDYKLSPFADGLLGRNELKLKLKRKARRAKLASSVGRPIDVSADDGINTGWICVNVGEVDGGPAFAREQEERAKRLEGFTTGFGTEEKGPKIVVQMFTEEKRAEVDLEGLYDRRATRKAEKLEALIEAPSDSIPKVMRSRASLAAEAMDREPDRPTRSYTAFDAA